MPLKIRPNAIEQDQGHFIFPGVIALDGTSEFTFDAAGVTGSALISARDTTSGFKTPVTIRGSAIHLVGNEDLIALRVEEGGGQGWLRINPTAKDYDLSYLADDGTVLLYGDAGLGFIGVGTDSPTHNLTVLGKVGEGFTQRNTRVIASSFGGAAAFDLVVQTTGSVIGQNLGAGFTFSVDSAIISPTLSAGVYGKTLHAENAGAVGFWTMSGSSWKERAYLAADGLHFNYDEMGLQATGSMSIRPSGDLLLSPGGNPILDDDHYLQFGQFTTGTAAWPAEPAMGDWILFGQDMAWSNEITPYVRTNGSGPWSYPQPIVSREYGDFRITDSYHLYGTVYYVAGMINAVAFTSGAPAVDKYFLVPFVVNQRYVVTEIGFYVTVAGSAGSVARVGIYDMGSQGDSRPEKLIYDGGEKSTTSTGIKTTSGLSVELIPGRIYYAVYHCGVNAPTIRCIEGSACYPFMGIGAINGTVIGIGYDLDNSYAALVADAQSLGGGAFGATVPVPAIFMSFN